MAGPIAYPLVAFFDVSVGPVRPSVVPSGPLSSEGPIFWGRIILTVENRTQRMVMLEEASISGIHAFNDRLLRPVGDQFAERTAEVAQRPGLHRIRIATKPEGGASVLEQWFHVEVEAGYERHCFIVLHEASAEMAPCERGGRVDPYRLFD